MAVDWTTTALLASIRRRAFLPGSSAETLTDADLLTIATEELQTDVMELWLSITEEFGVKSSDQTLTAGTSTYVLPSRASSETLRDVQLLVGTGYVPLTRMEPERVWEWGGATTGTPASYYFQDNAIVLVPAPSETGTLRFLYHCRPSSLVATSAVATVSSINPARTVITTTSTIPSTIVSGASLDLVSHQPGFRILSLDATATATTSGTTVTVTTALPSNVVAGNYICLAGESPVAQVPPELHPLLAQRTAMKALEALGDARMQAAGSIYEQMRTRAISLLSPRSVGSARYIINRNAPGWNKFARRRRWQ